MVGSYGGTDSGTSASPSSYPVSLLSLIVVNECCMKKSLMPASCWKWTLQSVLKATTTNTTIWKQFSNKTKNIKPKIDALLTVNNTTILDSVLFCVHFSYKFS